MSAPDNLPSLIRTDGTDTFAHNTFRLRHPLMITRLIEQNPDFQPMVVDELRLLRDDLRSNREILMLNLFPTPPPDYTDWAAALVERSHPQTRQRPTWLNTDWFFAETMLFRLIVEATRWWEHRIDPYTPMKQDEISSEALWVMLGEALNLAGGVHDRLPTLLRMAMWGNRMDLSYDEAQGAAGTDADILVNDADAFQTYMLRTQLDYFPEREQGIAHVILDNTGTELAMDLALVDTLLHGYSDIVILHTKFHPTFVSDATNADVLQMIRRCERGPHGNHTIPEIQGLGIRLRNAFEAGRLRLAESLYWNSANFMWDMPRALRHVLEDSQIIIVKGDANYRRLVGDALWDATTPFKQVVRYMPSSVLALRTLKSYPVLGLSAAQTRELDNANPLWRVSGERGVIQLADFKGTD